MPLFPWVSNFIKCTWSLNWQAGGVNASSSDYHFLGGLTLLLFQIWRSVSFVMFNILKSVSCNKMQRELTGINRKCYPFCDPLGVCWYGDSSSFLGWGIKLCRITPHLGVSALFRIAAGWKHNLLCFHWIIALNKIIFLSFPYNYSFLLSQACILNVLPVNLIFASKVSGFLVIDEHNAK